MTPEDVITRLRELVSKWRNGTASQVGDTPLATEADRCIAMMCADELDILLSTLSGAEGRQEEHYDTCTQCACMRPCHAHPNDPGWFAKTPPPDAPGPAEESKP